MKTVTELRQIEHNDELLNYGLTRKNVKNINLIVKSNGSVVVSASKAVSILSIERFIISKWDVIFSHVKKILEENERDVLPKEYVNGEFFYFLGEKLILKVFEENKESVHVDGDQLCLNVIDGENFKDKENLIFNFFDDNCNKYFSEIVDDIYPIFEKYNVPYPIIKRKNMKSRWGSCTPSKNQITLNTNLIKVPRRCIEYIVLHELAHFVHFNHSKDYYNLLSLLMPDYKERSEVLDTYGFLVSCK